MRYTIILACYAITLLCLTACVESPLPRGVVATVNGQPIALRTLETMLDTRAVGLGVAENTSLATLRQQYGRALLSCISQTLIMQELNMRGIGVSDAALALAEQHIRADYTEEEFEKNFIENAIDVDAWRELMRQRIALERFVSHILRPTLYVPLEEIEAYYQDRSASFTVPRSLLIWQLQSYDRTALEQVRTVSPLPPYLSETSPHITAYRTTVALDALPPEWQKAVQVLRAGEYTPVRGKDGFFEVVYLQEIMPQRQLTLLEAYPYIEQILIEEKLETAFQDWLVKVLAKAQIRVSPHLAAQVRGESQ